MQTCPHIAIIYGPTASGKSAFALDIADSIPSVIINADAMQCYAPLRIITARPTPEEEARHPHALYGIWPANTNGHVARWLEEATQAINAAWQQNRLPVLVGGTGMYIKALMEGLHPVPEISDTIRKQVHIMSPEARYQALCKEDAAMATKLAPGDTQRIFRALEVIRSTSKSLLSWQDAPLSPALQSAAFHCIKLTLTRETLYARINARFDAMLKAGALQEVSAFLNTNPDQQSPIYKAHGVPEFNAYLQGNITLETAIDKAKQHTRNYAKRQETWARGQFSHAINFAPDQANLAISQLQQYLNQ